MTRLTPGCITIFTPSDAARDNTNAQNLTVKEVVARLPEDEFHVTMLCDGDAPHPGLAARRNTRFVAWGRHGNTVRLLRHCLFPPPDIYFFPRCGPLDRVFLDLRARLGLRTALVTHIQMVMNNLTGRGLVGRSIREADSVFGNSRYVVQTIREVFGVTASPIYDGVDRRHYFPSNESPKNAAVVLYAGSLQPRKRVELVVAHAARFPGLQFRIAGKGETEKHCRETAAQLGCGNVSFLGHLSQEELGKEMRSADIFLFPSILEGNPQVLLQASACGLPCIAMDLYHSDYVVNGKTGLLARSDSELSECLRLLVDDATLRQSFAAAAAGHASQFNWNDIAAKWAAVFRETVARRRDHHERRAS